MGRILLAIEPLAIYATWALATVVLIALAARQERHGFRYIALAAVASILGLGGIDIYKCAVTLSSGAKIVEALPRGSTQAEVERQLQENQTNFHIWTVDAPSDWEWNDEKSLSPHYHITFNMGFSLWATVVERKGFLDIHMDKGTRKVTGHGWHL